jgi:hypothetical protein
MTRITLPLVALGALAMGGSAVAAGGNGLPTADQQRDTAAVSHATEGRIAIPGWNANVAPVLVTDVAISVSELRADPQIVDMGPNATSLKLTRTALYAAGQALPEPQVGALLSIDTVAEMLSSNPPTTLEVDGTTIKAQRVALADVIPGWQMPNAIDPVSRGLVMDPGTRKVEPADEAGRRLRRQGSRR